MTLQKMSPPEVALQMQTLQDWSYDENSGSVTRKFVLLDFVRAFDFMKQIAIAAEKYDHHPEWRNVYNKVTITWTTHDVKGMSHKDVDMAHICDQIYSNFMS